jgi:hypothetical protein
MRSFTRRGLASFAVASVLIFAPLGTTVAFADDEPAIETPIVEALAVETPVVETPAVETPVVEQPAVETSVVETPSEEPSEPAPAAESAPVASRVAAAPESSAIAYTCDYRSGSYGYNYFPFCVDASVDGTTGTAFWNPRDMGDGYYFELYDVSANWTHVMSGSTSATSFDFATIPGHYYYVYAHNYYWADTLYFTAASVPPEAPASLTATRSVTSNSFNLGWTASVANADNPVVSYTVDVASALGGHVSTTSVTAPAFTATNLMIDEEYTFTVTAVGQNGERSAPATTVVTLEAVAPTAAADVVLTRSGETLAASWTEPTYHGGSGAVHYWIVLYADGNYAGQYHQDALSLTFTQTAQFDVEYTAVVVAYNDAGDAPAFTSNSVMRADSAPGTPTAYTDAYGYKDARVHVSWDLAAASGSAVHSLSITLYDADGDLFTRETVSLAGNRTSMDFTGLPNDTAFTVTIAAINDAGPSAQSAPVAVTTLGLVPPAPTSADLTPANNYAGVTVGLTGTTLTAHINGLSAGDWVYGTAFSTPTGLGWTQVDAAGTATWSIAGANLPAGAHTLAVQNTFGATLGSAGFTIAAAPAAAAALAHAGSDPSGWMTIALAMLALGIVATVTKSHRRARA